MIVLIAATTPLPGSTQEYSKLWGKAGEAWTPDSRLPDVSFAGYRFGEKPLPDVDVVANVRDFGATGDGETDDSKAFLDAIAATESGSILIPDGTYVLNRILEIRKSGIVLKGESRDGTVLYFPVPLQTIRPNWGATTTGDKTSNYSWSGGFIQAIGSYQSETITGIPDPVDRGDRWIPVESTESLSVGQWIDVRQQDTEENTLARHMYSGDSGPVALIRGRTRTSMTARITAIEDGRIQLERPLRFDIRRQWSPGVYRFEPTVSEVGIENLTFRYPVTPYGGHFSEMGFNAIAFRDVVHCWARNIRIQHADSGIFNSGRFTTIDGLLFESDREPDSRGETGHHGVSLTDDDNLVTNFDYRTSFIHDITVTHCSGNAITRGTGVNLSFDHHRRVPYGNVFSDIHVGLGEDTWRCGGGRSLGKHCASWGTFWNIRSDNPLSYPPEGFGSVMINVVGIHTNDDGETNPEGRWFEVIAPKDLVPQNLHAAQQERRLKGK